MGGSGNLAKPQQHAKGPIRPKEWGRGKQHYGDAGESDITTAPSLVEPGEGGTGLPVRAALACGTA